MFRLCHRALLNKGLFGIGISNISEQQRKARKVLGERTLQDALPGIAAMWVSDSGKNNLVSPANLKCLSSKKQKWKCLACGHRFAETVCRLTDRSGACPSCHQVPVAKPIKKSLITTSGATTTPPPLRSVKSNGAFGNYDRAYSVSPSLANRSIDPMLAREWADCQKTVDFSGETLYVSPKLDGMRCLVAWAPEVKRVLYISRRGSLFECCDSLDAHFLPLFEEDPTLMLDGELYTSRVSFEELSSLVRTTHKGRTEAMKRQQEMLQYHAFDVMYSSSIPDVKKTWFSQRLDLLKTLLPARSTKEAASLSPSSPNFISLLHVPAETCVAADADNLLDAAIADGYEGIMFRRDKFPYGFGKRTNALMKYKKFDTAEFVVEDVTEGIGRCAGQAGALICRTDRGIVFHATPRSVAAVRAEIWNRRSDIIGKAITVQYQGLSPEKVPRFPVALCVRGAADGSDWF